MISIANWYSIKAKRPLLGLIASIIVVQAIYLVSVVRVNEKRHSDLVENLIRFTSVALMQKNRVMLESLVYTVSENADFKTFVLCQGINPVVSYPSALSSCDLAGSTLFTISQIEAIPGFGEYKIMTSSRRLKVSPGYLIVVCLTILLSIVSVFVILMITRRFEVEILSPILNDFNNSDSEAIEEFVALKKRRNQVIELEKEKVFSALARQVVHDIRSPLSALQIFVKSKSNALGADVDFLSAISKRVSQIADDLLDRSRKPLESPRSSLLGLVEETRRVVDEKVVRFPQSEIQMKVDLSKMEEAFVDVLPVEWGRIISNLIDNSVEATIGNMVHIELSFSELEGKLLFICADRGSGVSKEVLSALKIKGGSYGKARGNGIGLEHLKRVIGDVNGHWDIISDQGKGLSVAIEIPTYPR